MQGGRDRFFGFGDPFGMGGAGGQRDLISSFFGGRDPFDDPFFTRPFGSMFESSFFGPNGGPFRHALPSGFFGPRGGPFMDAQQSGFFGPNGGPLMDAQPSGFVEHHSSQLPRSRGPIIEELDSDDEENEKADKEEKKDNPRKHGRSTKEPLVEDPDDDAEERRRKQMQLRNDYHRGSVPQSQPRTQSFSFQSSSVTYGGANGAYYTSSTRRAGSDGLTFEENKEANSATRQASHRISRGIHDKGHSVTRRLNSDGRVDAMQTLHNLEEDQLAGFDEAWKGKAKKHLPGCSDGLNAQGGFGSSTLNGPNPGVRALPHVGWSNELENGARPELGHAAGPSPPPPRAARGRADVGGMSGSSSRVKSRAPDMANLNQARKH